MPDPVEAMTTVNESFSVTIPASVRERVDLEVGDALRWRAVDDGSVSVEIVQRQVGAFADLEPVEVEETTNVAFDHDEIPE